MSPFAFEIYWMTYETYRLSIRFLVREIIIIAIICVKTPRITSFLIIFIIFAPNNNFHTDWLNIIYPRLKVA